MGSFWVLLLTVPAAVAAPPKYLVVPGANGFQIDMFAGGKDIYQFDPPRYLENRGHVGTWMTEGPRRFHGKKVPPPEPHPGPFLDLTPPTLGSS